MCEVSDFGAFAAISFEKTERNIIQFSPLVAQQLQFLYIFIRQLGDRVFERGQQETYQ